MKNYKIGMNTTMLLWLLKRTKHQSLHYNVLTSSLLKAQKDLAELEDAVCYTCGQALHEDKKAEIAERKQKELEDAQPVQTK